MKYPPPQKKTQKKLQNIYLWYKMLYNALTFYMTIYDLEIKLVSLFQRFCIFNDFKSFYLRSVGYITSYKFIFQIDMSTYAVPLVTCLATWSCVSYRDPKYFFNLRTNICNFWFNPNNSDVISW